MANKINQLDKYSQRLILVLTLLALALLTSPASAQSYYFSVPELQMQVYVQADSTVLIEYDITFSNSSFGQAIDIVDIGMPTSDYDFSNMSASVDGCLLYTSRCV